MKLICNGKELSLGKDSFLIEDLFTKDFYSYSNYMAEKFYIESYSVNEVYGNLIQPYLALDKYIEDNENVIDLIDVSHSDRSILLYLMDLGIKHKIKVTGYPSFIKSRIRFSFFFTKLASFLYLTFLMLKIPYSREVIKEVDKFSVLRFKSQFVKTNNFKEIYRELENPHEKNSVYRFFPVRTRVLWVMKSYFSSRNSIKKMLQFYIPLFGEYSSYSLFVFYKKRIVYAELYQLLLDSYFPHFMGKSYYMMNNLDRFSVIEEKTARRYNIKTYCIPHGIEYGFRFPKGFAADIFYTMADNTAVILNRLYNTNKFIYDESVINRLMGLNYQIEHEPYIVYFTEPREIYVNQEIIKGILPELKKKGRGLCLKLHPGDSTSNYSEFDVKIVSNYAESLTGNICIARKSTMLLEAIHNNSTAIAIITNPKDQTMFDNFPSLNTSKINKAYSVKELLDQIDKYLEKWD